MDFISVSGNKISLVFREKNNKYLVSLLSLLKFITWKNLMLLL